jgi:hypothetical protein
MAKGESTLSASSTSLVTGPGAAEESAGAADAEAGAVDSGALPTLCSGAAVLVSAAGSLSRGVWAASDGAGVESAAAGTGVPLSVLIRLRDGSPSLSSASLVAAGASGSGSGFFRLGCRGASTMDNRCESPLEQPTKTTRGRTEQAQIAGPLTPAWKTRR